ncbi:zinc-dependent alcohol dehydrogenase [Clostridium felsineum]|uniref:Scyllo-inosose 3-dehydrogenase n=1 Tax=Clostridium felsineum TaxID=36839 RepID=A0A1S8MC27_9CLOT|nr:alcohol dehydrogenase catalytic domain-containing protein [Clostridium felsineum]URZ07886.1 scyllo-inosose 3-dehydrogenase [Clostridium felsineum]URZ12917.1 scyllo-inosose 3-dehydrogenase [Clostridium felsineum]
MKTKVLLVKAEESPINKNDNLLPNQIYKNARIIVEDREMGGLQPDEIRIEVLYVGICGTDVHLAINNPKTGYISSTAPLTIPKEGRIIGHEGVGKVLQVGQNVKNIEPGMYVTLESIIVCNTCDVCRRGDFNQCRNAVLLGLEKDGLMAEIADVPAKIAHDITDYVNDDKDLIAAACIEPAGVAYVACENANIKGGDVVVIFGGGPIGIFAAMISKAAFGAAEVYIVEPIEHRRRLAKQWANEVYDVEEFFEKFDKKVNVVLEASGALSNVSNIFERIDANGHVVLIARSGASLSITNVDHMITNSIDIKGSRGHLCGAFNKIINLYRSGKIDLSSVVTSVIYGLDNLKEVLEDTKNLTENNCKVIAKLKNK